MRSKVFQAGGLLALAVSAALVGRSLSAFSGGISGYSGNPSTGGVFCNDCHLGGNVPIVTISGPTTVEPGSTNTYLLRIVQPDPNNNQAGGLDVSATDGVLSVSDPGTQSLDSEITHNAPRAMVAGDVSFTFNWTAPLTPASVILYGAGNAVSLTQGQLRDRAATATLDIQVEAAPAGPGETSAPALSPLLVTAFDQVTEELTISFDTACEATDNNIYFGPLSDVSTYGWTGEVCGIGTSGTFSGFDPGAGSFFFLVVGTKAAVEGSYGVNGSSVERPPFAGNTCGQTQDLANTCD